MHWFLAVFLACGLLHLELFPFSAFRLFSEVRTSERVSWELQAVDRAGAEHPIRLSELPIGYRNSTRLLSGFASRDEAERTAICDGWAAPGRAAGEDIVVVHVYEVLTSLRPDGPPPTRQLAYECGTPP